MKKEKWINVIYGEIYEKLEMTDFLNLEITFLLWWITLDKVIVTTFLPCERCPVCINMTSCIEGNNLYLSFS